MIVPSAGATPITPTIGLAGNDTLSFSQIVPSSIFRIRVAGASQNSTS